MLKMSGVKICNMIIRFWLMHVDLDEDALDIVQPLIEAKGSSFMRQAASHSLYFDIDNDRYLLEGKIREVQAHMELPILTYTIHADKYRIEVNYTSLFHKPRKLIFDFNKSLAEMDTIYVHALEVLSKQATWGREHAYKA